MVETKPDLTPVTEADTAVERALRDRLGAVRPEDAIVGEEYGASDGPDGGRRWIVDPIDGTKNYVRGIPVWATLLALQSGDQVDGRCGLRAGAGAAVVGVARAPARSGDALLDGAAARCRSRRCARSRTPSCASRGSTAGRTAAGSSKLLSLARRCWRTRGFGDFWTYMLVAEGVAEIGCEAIVSLWDLAAPQMIVEEAGGTFTDLGGVRTADGGDALATNGLLHEQALAIVGRSG